MIISIPCTPLSRCILTTEYGPAPFRVSRAHELWPFIRPHAPGDRIGKAHVVGRRSATFEVQVSRQLGERMLRLPNDGGIALHRQHIDLMLRFVQAKGSPYREALRTFYRTYGITDFEYDFDSAYRMWMRFAKKNEKRQGNNCAKSAHFVTRRHNVSINIKPSDDDLRKLINFVLPRLRYHMPRLPKYVYRQTELYLYVIYGQRTRREAAQHYHRPKSTVEHSVRRIKGYVDVDADFARLVDPQKLFPAKPLAANT